MRIKNENKIDITPSRLLNKKKNDSFQIFCEPIRELTLENIISEILNNKELLRITGGEASLLMIIGGDFEIVPRLWYSHVPLEEKESYLLTAKKNSGFGTITKKEQERLRILEKKIGARHRVLYANMPPEDKRTFTDEDERIELTMYDKLPVAECIEGTQLDPQNSLGLKKIGEVMKARIRDYARTNYKRDWEDVWQDIWLKAVTKLIQSVDRKLYNLERDDLATYFKKIVLNTIADDQREKIGRTKTKPVIVPLDEDRDTDNPLDKISYSDKTDVKIDMEMTLNRIKKEHKNLLTLHYIEGFSLKEIAKRLDKNEGAVKTQLLRARKAVKRAFSSSSLEV